jgi:hypothetical protein
MSRAADNDIADKVWTAVQAAVWAGWSVEKFRRECASAWDEMLRKEREYAAKSWTEAPR